MYKKEGKIKIFLLSCKIFNLEVLTAMGFFNRMVARCARIVDANGDRRVPCTPALDQLACWIAPLISTAEPHANSEFRIL